MTEPESAPHLAESSVLTSVHRERQCCRLHTWHLCMLPCRACSVQGRVLPQPGNTTQVLDLAWTTGCELAWRGTRS